MTPEQLDRLCRAAYLAATQGYALPPWDALRGCDRHRFEQGVLAVLQELAAIEDERPRHTRVVRPVEPQPETNVRSTAGMARWWERKRVG